MTELTREDLAEICRLRNLADISPDPLDQAIFEAGKRSGFNDGIEAAAKECDARQYTSSADVIRAIKRSVL